MNSEEREQDRHHEQHLSVFRFSLQAEPVSPAKLPQVIVRHQTYLFNTGIVSAEITTGEICRGLSSRRHLCSSLWGFRPNQTKVTADRQR